MMHHIALSVSIPALFHFLSSTRCLSSSIPSLYSCKLVSLFLFYSIMSFLLSFSTSHPFFLLLSVSPLSLSSPNPSIYSPFLTVSHQITQSSSARSFSLSQSLRLPRLSHCLRRKLNATVLFLFFFVHLNLNQQLYVIRPRRRSAHHRAFNSLKRLSFFCLPSISVYN